ncbi:MAG: glycosyltransferase family 39 protein [Candidatus Melainabacteria bacterium]|nr:glycosyltransferase family 39 protein [Candidatus Melainabacteria bacterium]
MKLKDKESYSFENSSFFKILFVLLFLFVLLYFFKLGSVGLIDVDEPRYAEAGREILESGNWIVPYFNYVVRFDKPILFYWLEAISMKVFGVNEFAARLPSVISALMCAGFIYYLLRTFYGQLVSLLGVLVLMSCFEFASLSRFSITDMTLASLISCSTICFFLGYNQLISSHRFFKFQISEFTPWYILGFIFLALAFLTKGPVSLIIIFLILAPFFWWIRKLDYFLKSSSFYLGFILFLLMVTPWYLAVHFATNGEFTKIFFGLHNFSRFTGVVSGHKGSFFYFIPVILIGFLPWAFFLPQAISCILKKGLKSLLVSPKSQLPWFCLWWFIVVLLFFSFSKTKLLTYILPLFPALSIIIALWLEEILTKRAGNRGLTIGLGVFFFFSIIILYFCLFKLNILLPREIKSLKLDFQIMLFAFLLFVGVSMAWASSHRDESMTISIILCTFVLFYFCFVTFLLPKIDRHSQLLLRKFALTVPRDVEVGMYKIIKPSLTFYARRQIKNIDSLDELQEKLNQKEKFAFVTKRKFLEGVTLENSYVWQADSRYIFCTNYPLRWRHTH